MQTLTYGLQLPEDGDTGSIVFPALEDNITQLDAHDHDGVTSAQLSRTSINSTLQTISSASWSATSGGTYRQLVTMPAGLTYPHVFINFRLLTLQHQIFPTVEYVSSTTYYVYTNDNTLDYQAVYG